MLRTWARIQHKLAITQATFSGKMKKKSSTYKNPACDHHSRKWMHRNIKLPNLVQWNAVNVATNGATL
jgi:hypothetical protein